MPELVRWLVRATYQVEFGPRENHTYEDCIDVQECHSCSSHAWEMVNDPLEFVVVGDNEATALEAAKAALPLEARDKWAHETPDKQQLPVARILSITKVERAA